MHDFLGLLPIPNYCKDFKANNVSYDLMFKNILVAVDGSKYAEAAFEAAVDIAQKYDSRLIVLHVFSGSTGSGAIVSRLGDDPNRSEAQELLKYYEGKVKSKGLRRAKTFLKKGDAAQRIIETARSDEVELIVLGSRGRGGFKGLLLGSVSSKVSNHARCPVLIVK